jgi:hypothetical protein
MLVVSGDAASWLTPCGCTSNQSGGLLRRATYLKGLASQGAAVIYADAGGAPGGTSEYQRVKFEAILRGELLMNVTAHNIGRAEAALGPEYLRDVAKRLAVPLISANAIDERGVAVAPASRIVDIAGRRVALVGVLSTTFATDSIRVQDPIPSLQREITSINGTYDLLVVLAYVPEDELQRLAAATPEADAVIGGPTGQAIAPRRAGPTLVASATNKGKFVVQIDLGAKPMDGTIVELGPSFGDDAAQKANVDQYLAELASRDFPAGQTGLAPTAPATQPAGYRIAGSASCVTCHVSAHASWSGSHHAHAFETLRRKGFHVDPSCQQCHTTAYGQPGGFLTIAQSASTMGGVGCESCHGPSAAHVAEPTKMRTAFAKASADQCVRCHDHENSPQFNIDVYWSRVKHGLDAKAGVR